MEEKWLERENTMLDLYNNNADFHSYVDAYMRNKDVKLEDVLEEKIVREVGKIYKEKEKDNENKIE
jgi:hypothetical protein